ncbi:MAG TPA: formyltetrahydrofolate deformylase [Allosphingosinicella sp.]|jgi:formyltetrahydrofolate deformylase
MGRGFVLTLTCPDRVGVAAAVTGFLATRDGFITDSQQYADLETGRFFMRVAFQAGGPRFPEPEPIREDFEVVAAAFDFSWAVHDSDQRPRILVAVSKGAHCLGDLLFRWESRVLPVEIAGIVSNHRDLEWLARRYDVPFHHLPVDPSSRDQQEHALLGLLADQECELLVLARYMQVLSPALVRKLAGRCVNIHHSFLPGFKGARPYHRAHERGVKLIGATAHFVTEELDEGPIIEQAVERVDHRASVEDLIRIGRDIEAQVLARAIAWLGERRVLLNGGRTVVFR